MRKEAFSSSRLALSLVVVFEVLHVRSMIVTKHLPFSFLLARRNLLMPTSRTPMRNMKRRTSRPFGSIGSTRLFTSSKKDVPAIPIHYSSFANQTVQSVLQTSLSLLTDANVPEASASVVHLLAKVLDLDWSTGYRDLQTLLMKDRHYDDSLLASRPLTPEQALALANLLSRRVQHEPIQYLVGAWDFLDYRLVIRPPLLCPRPETEELVERVVQSVHPQETLSNYYILDVGCGTGCIGIALADRLRGAIVHAIDIEPIAVETAMENAHAVLRDRQHYYKAELVSIDDYSCRTKDDDSQVLYNLVVSNPPYIPAADMESLDDTVVRYESKTALCGGLDGLDVISTILDRLPDLCVDGASCWMEVDPTHPKLLQEACHAGRFEGVEYVQSHNDMFGRERFVEFRVRM